MADYRAQLGGMVRAARRQADLTQEELARRVGIGTSTLRSIEAGKADGPNFYSVLSLLAALDIDPNALRPLMRVHASTKRTSLG